MNCPACDGSERSIKYHVRGYTLYECRDCRGYYIDGAAQAHYEGDYLRKSTGEGRSLVGYYDYERELDLHLRTYRKHLAIIARYKPGGSLLDIGCASGHFLYAASLRGYDVEGVDISSDSVSQLQEQFKIPARAGDVRNLEFNRRFDVITAWETIEHIPEPLSVLEKLRSLLKPDGILVIGTGNNRSLVGRLLGKRWWYLNPPDHCVYYNPRALDALLKRAAMNIAGHHRVNLHWVSSRNVAQKLMRSFDAEAQSTLALASRLPDLGLPILHGTTMVHVARPPNA